jgi:GT2 family glycosyltransferase
MTESLPTFTIVVPSRDRPAQLSRCLMAIRQLNYPPDLLSVIVVDDGSDPPIEAAIRPFLNTMPLQLLVQAGAGPAAARNRGAAAAEGRFLAFTDDDCRPEHDWLLHLARRLMLSPERAVGGCTLNGLVGNPYSTASQLLISFLYSYYNTDPEDARFLTTNNLAVSRELYEQIGGLDTRYLRAAAEDREFCDRWQQRGWKLSYVPEAVVYHEHSMTLRNFWRQHWTYGRGAWRYRLARAARERGPLRIEPLRFYSRLLRTPLASGRSLPAAIQLSALLFLTQAANAGGFLTERILSGSRSSPAGEAAL